MKYFKYFILFNPHKTLGESLLSPFCRRRTYPNGWIVTFLSPRSVLFSFYVRKKSYLVLSLQLIILFSLQYEFSIHNCFITSSFAGRGWNAVPNNEQK